MLTISEKNEIKNELLVIKRSQNRIEKLLAPSTTDNFIHNSEFQKACKIGRTVFYRLKNSGKINWVKRGREIFIHKADVSRFLNGEIK